jgi:hypothetical protein
VAIDDKGGEIVHKDSEKQHKGERNKDTSDRGRTWHKGRDMTKERDQLTIKILSTQVGGANSWTYMVHLNVHFICLFAWHKLLNFNIHACVVYASYRFEWWNENLACIGYLVIFISECFQVVSC